MTDTLVYRDIANRTKGEIYIGVVGPVRSGKSTFIKKFMENAVIPNIESPFDRERARDELPQSAGGRTVMTTEPKFIPDEGVKITIGDGVSLKVKLVDCVGYMIPESLGATEEGNARMVHTPWHDEPIEFEEAAEYGTKKVITDHATIGILVTSDGTVGEFKRESYTDAEERVAYELTSLGKPFAIVLNSSDPSREESLRLALELEEKYGAPVALVNLMELSNDDIWHIMSMLLDEFPAKEVDVQLPDWLTVLPQEHKTLACIYSAVSEATKHMNRMQDVKGEMISCLESEISSIEGMEKYSEKPKAQIERIDAGEGKVTVSVKLPKELYYDTVSEITGMEIKNERQLFEILSSLAEAKDELDKYREAIRDANEKGYGVVMPSEDNLTLGTPELIRQSGGYGVKLKASATSIHMIKTTIDTELNPIVGGEEQSEEMIGYLTAQLESDPDSVWKTNMFGRTLYEMVHDGLYSKVEHMPEDARLRFGETLSRIINEGSQGLICILL